MNSCATGNGQGTPFFNTYIPKAQEDVKIYQEVKHTREKELVEACQKLQVDEYTTAKAICLMSELENRASPDDLEKLQGLWRVCTIFLANRLVRKESRETNVEFLPLWKILRHCNIRLDEFLSKYKTFSALMPTEISMNEYMDGLERTYFVITILYRKYQLLVASVFLPEESQPIIELGWLLFLVCRERLMSHSHDLVIMVYLNVCCLHFILLTAPEHIVVPAYKPDSKDLQENPLESTLLARLCSLVPLPFTEVCKVYDLFREFYSSLCKDTDLLQLSYSNCTTPSTPIMTSIAFPENILANIASLQNDYRKTIEKLPQQPIFEGRGESDEKKTTGEEMAVKSAKHSSVPYLGGDIEETMCLLPDFLPISTARPEEREAADQLASRMWSVRCLWEMISKIDHEGQLTTSLKDTYHSLGIDFNTIVTARTYNLEKAMLDQFTSMHGGEATAKSLIDAPFRLGVQLYLGTLYKINSTEMHRLTNAHLANLLCTNDMHNGLLACALELVIFSYGLTEINFHWLFKTLNLSPYAFQKVVEPFIRAWGLSKIQVSHLGEVEERVLEQMAWTEGSELFEQCQRVGVPGLHKVSGKTSDIKGKEKHLLVFFRKFYMIANQRITLLSRLLSLEPIVVQHVWWLFEYSITQHISLMQNRHVDQIVLCALYGTVCLGNRPLKFLSDIIPAYRQINGGPLAPQIYREVTLEGTEKGSLIQFYNNIYIPLVKSFILKNQLHSKHPWNNQTIGGQSYFRIGRGVGSIGDLSTTTNHCIIPGTSSSIGEESSQSTASQLQPQLGPIAHAHARSICFRGIGDSREREGTEKAVSANTLSSPSSPNSRLVFVPPPPNMVRPGHPYWPVQPPSGVRGPKTM